MNNQLWVIEQTQKPLPPVYKYFAISEHIELVQHYGQQRLGNVSFRVRKPDYGEQKIAMNYDIPHLEKG